MPRQGVIGLIGGMSWESSAEYYRIINQAVRDRLGGLRSARCLMWSFDFGEIEALQRAGRWDEAAALLIDAARRLERGGADFFLICTNTMHRMADEVQAAVRIPLATVGLLQYIAPVMQFLIGVLVNGEPMPLSRLAGFVLVWLALGVFMVDAVRALRAGARVVPDPPASEGGAMAPVLARR